MNASATNNFRVNRIKLVSRVFRWFVLANLVFNIGFWVLFISSSEMAQFNIRALLTKASVLLMFLWFWKLAHLFRLYERGLIFAAETIRCIKILGVVCLAGWLVLVAAHFTPRPEPVPHTYPAGVKVVKVTQHSYRMGFFSFDFGTGIDFGLLFVGAAVVFAAWIMDAGRKIQEEQELTV